MLDLNRTNAALLRVETSRIQLQDLRYELKQATHQRQQAQLNVRELEDAIELAKKCLEESIKRKQYIEKLLSQALSELYLAVYEFELEVLMDDEGSMKGIRPRLRIDGGPWRDPYKNFGRGVGGVIDLFLTLICLAFVGGTCHFVFFDEPLAHLGSRMQSRLESLLHSICQYLKIQMVMITHQESPFGKVYVVKLVDHVSKVSVCKTFG